MNENPFDEEFLTKLENIEPSEKYKQISEAITQRARKDSAIADEIEQRNAKRYKYANYFMIAAFSWLLFVAIIVLVSRIEGSPLSLSDTVLVALLTTATVNVLAPAFLLAKYLFHSQE